MVTQAFNSITQEKEAADLCKFKATLVYKVSSWTVRIVVQKNPISKTKQKVTVKSHPYHYKILKHSEIFTYLKITTDFLQG